jgi:putative protease
MPEQEIGKISHYYNHLSVGIIDLSAPLAVGDTIHIKGAHDDFTQTVDSIQLEHESVESAEAGMSAGVKVAQKVHENDKVFKVTE